MSRSGRGGRSRGATGRTSRHGSLRVVSGTARGLRLDAPTGSTTRPTTDRVRQAIFNALESLDAIEGASVLDAFAGSGALGVEALSRGAATVTFVDVDPAARRVVDTNLARTGFDDRGVVVGGDGSSYLARGPWDLVLLDPPYAIADWAEMLIAARDGISAEGVIVVESDREVEPPDGLRTARSRRYGSTVVTFLTRPGATP